MSLPPNGELKCIIIIIIIMIMIIIHYHKSVFAAKPEEGRKEGTKEPVLTPHNFSPNAAGAEVVAT